MVLKFRFSSRNVKEMYTKLLRGLNKTEPCSIDGFKVDTDKYRAGAEKSDIYMADFASKNVTRKEAALLCSGCHVLELCKSYAIEADEPYGIWGGTTPRMRKEMKRVRKEL